MLRTKLENDYNDNNSNSLNRFEPPSQTLTSPLRLLFPNPLFSIRISRDCEFSSRENFIGAKRLIKDAHLFENLLEARIKPGNLLIGERLAAFIMEGGRVICYLHIIRGAALRGPTGRN